MSRRGHDAPGAGRLQAVELGCEQLAHLLAEEGAVLSQQAGEHGLEGGAEASDLGCLAELVEQTEALVDEGI